MRVKSICTLGNKIHNVGGIAYAEESYCGDAIVLFAD